VFPVSLISSVFDMPMRYHHASGTGRCAYMPYDVVGMEPKNLAGLMPCAPTMKEHIKPFITMYVCLCLNHTRGLGSWWFTVRLLRAVSTLRYSSVMLSYGACGERPLFISAEGRSVEPWGALTVGFDALIMTARMVYISFIIVIMAVKCRSVHWVLVFSEVWAMQWAVVFSVSFQWV
jgi:hypothetical protein